MKNLIFILILFFGLLGCSKVVNIEKTQEEGPQLGHFDNFLQVWQENTADELHQVEFEVDHEHMHLQFEEVADAANTYSVKIFEGRNNKEFKEEVRVSLQKNSSGYWSTSDQSIVLSGDTLEVFAIGSYVVPEEEPYRLLRCRYFSGWIQYEMKSIEDSTYFQRDLVIHDQGGMAELDIDDSDYTVELTQLVYGKTISLMKVALYNMPLDEVGINSRSEVYAWTSPDAKRVGINIRKIASGWTLIEEGYVSSNNNKDLRPEEQDK